MTLIQYVIVRGDLMKVLKWNIGAVITQCCHAVAAVNQLTKDDELTKSYLSEQNLDSMHKCVLQIPDKESIEQLAKTLDENQIQYKLWIEQPENIPTCIAVKAYEKETVQEHFKAFKLMR